MGAIMQGYMECEVRDQVSPTKARIIHNENVVAYLSHQIDALKDANEQLRINLNMQDDRMSAMYEAMDHDRELFHSMITECRKGNKHEVFDMVRRLDQYWRFTTKVSQATQTRDLEWEDLPMKRVAERLFGEKPQPLTPAERFNMIYPDQANNSAKHQKRSRRAMIQATVETNVLRKKLDEEVIESVPFQFNPARFVDQQRRQEWNDIQARQPATPEAFLAMPATPPRSHNSSHDDSWETIELVVENGWANAHRFPVDIEPGAAANNESWWFEPSEYASEDESFSSCLGDGNIGFEAGVTNKVTPSLSRTRPNVRTSPSMSNLEDDVQTLLIKSKNPGKCSRCGHRESIETLAPMPTPPAMAWYSNSHVHQWAGWQGRVPIRHLCPDKAQTMKRLVDRGFAGSSSSSGSYADRPRSSTPW